MASKFPAYVAKEYDKTAVFEYTPGTTTDAFVVGSLIFYDTGTNTMKLCAADPALIAGISEISSVANALITPNAKVPCRILRNGAVLAFSSSTTPADSHVGDQYGVTKSSEGYWQLDTAKTGASARVLVIAVDIGLGIFYGSVLNDQLQFGAVA